MKYKVIIAENCRDLEVYVNKYIQHGWELQGGVSVCVPAPHWSSTVYAQAMVQREIES